jgi:hypothetical protein
MNASQIFDGIPPCPGRIKRKAKVINRKKVRIHIWLHCHSPVCSQNQNFYASVEFLLLRPMEKKTATRSFNSSMRGIK